MATNAQSVASVSARGRAIVLNTTALVIVLGPMLAFAIAIVQPVDFDYWWHSRTGEYIIDELAVPRTDPFTFTAAGKHWVDHEWLSQILMFGVDGTLGYLALFTAFFALGLAAWWLVLKLLRAEGLGVAQAALIALAPLVMGAMHWRARPAMFTVLFVALFLYEVAAARRGERKTLWRLAPIMVLWANLHGGYVIGLVLLGMFAVAQFWDRRTTTGPTWKHCAGLLAVSFILTGINPYTYEIWLYPFTYFYGDNASLRAIDEWQSPDFHELRSIPIAILLITAMLAGVNGKRFDVWRSLLVIVFGAMALQSMRHQVLFGLVWAVTVGPSLAERWAWWRKEHVLTQGVPAMNWALLAGASAACLTVILVSPRGMPLYNAPTGGGMAFPEAGAAYIEREHPGANVFNLYDWGGYLIHESYPANRIFIDGRADLHGSLVTEYRDITALEDWQESFERYGVDIVLIPPSPKFEAALFDEGWTVGYSDEVQTVLLSPELSEQ